MHYSYCSSWGMALAIGEVPDGLMGNLFCDNSSNCNFASRGSLAPARLSGSQSPFFLLHVSAVLPDCCRTKQHGEPVGACCPRIQFAGIVRLSLVRVGFCVFTFGRALFAAGIASAWWYSTLAVRRYRTHHSSSSSRLLMPAAPPLDF